MQKKSLWWLVDSTLSTHYKMIVLLSMPHQPSHYMHCFANPFHPLSMSSNWHGGNIMNKKRILNYHKNNLFSLNLAWYGKTKNWKFFETGTAKSDLIITIKYFTAICQKPRSAKLSREPRLGLNTSNSRYWLPHFWQWVTPAQLLLHLMLLTLLSQPILTSDPATT